MEEIIHSISSLGGYIGSILATSFYLYYLCEEFKENRKNYPNLSPIYLMQPYYPFILAAVIFAGYCGGYALTMVLPVIIPGCFVCKMLYANFNVYLPYSKM
jgi:hypothetical protein